MASRWDPGWGGRRSEIHSVDHPRDNHHLLSHCDSFVEMERLVRGLRFLYWKSSRNSEFVVDGGPFLPLLNEMGESRIFQFLHVQPDPGGSHAA